MATIERYSLTDGKMRYQVRYRTPERTQTKKRGFLTKRTVETCAYAEVRGRLVLDTAKNHERRSVPFPAFLQEPLTLLAAGKPRSDLLFAGPKAWVTEMRRRAMSTWPTVDAPWLLDEHHRDTKCAHDQLHSWQCFRAIESPTAAAERCAGTDLQASQDRGVRRLSGATDRRR